MQDQCLQAVAIHVLSLAATKHGQTVGGMHFDHACCSILSGYSNQGRGNLEALYIQIYVQYIYIYISALPLPKEACDII